VKASHWLLPGSASRQSAVAISLFAGVVVHTDGHVPKVKKGGFNKELQPHVMGHNICMY
jgi:hypothetical protein